jgi:hypothetical protein
VAYSCRTQPPFAALDDFLHRCFRDQLDEAEMSAVLTELPWNQRTYRPLAYDSTTVARSSWLNVPPNRLKS